MPRWIRSVLGVVLGLFAAGLVIMTVQGIGHQAFPLPEGIDPKDPESLKAGMDRIPLGAMLFVLLAYLVGTIAGAWLAARIAGRAAILHGLIVGLFLLAGSIANLMKIPHPVWFALVNLLIYLPAAWLGARVAAGRQRQVGTNVEAG